MAPSETQHDSKTRFLNTALHVVRAKGYEATTVDDICRAAGLTKGSFFYHFKSKEELALAAADHFAAMAAGFFASAPYHALANPLDRVLGYVDFRAAILMGELPEYTCLLGMMVQEVYQTHPAIREACERHISEHAAVVSRDIAQAKQKYAPQAPWSPEGLGLYTQAVLQGAFILAKARHGPQVAGECIGHLRRYLELLFMKPSSIESAQVTSVTSRITEGDSPVPCATHPKETRMPSTFVQPYLFFGGRCEEALSFYRAAVGAQVEMMMRFKDSPEPHPPGMVPPGFENKVMHASFRIGGTTLMASDGCGEVSKFEGFSLSLSVPSEAEADRAFAALSEGGQVKMPLGKTFWSPRFGMLADRFGIGWMVSVTAG